MSKEWGTSKEVIGISKPLIYHRHREKNKIKYTNSESKTNNLLDYGVKITVVDDYLSDKEDPA
jgi:hypothetical protein